MEWKNVLPFKNKNWNRTLKASLPIDVTDRVDTHTHTHTTHFSFSHTVNFHSAFIFIYEAFTRLRSIESFTCLFLCRLVSTDSIRVALCICIHVQFNWLGFFFCICIGRWKSDTLTQKKKKKKKIRKKKTRKLSFWCSALYPLWSNYVSISS